MPRGRAQPRPPLCPDRPWGNAASPCWLRSAPGARSPALLSQDRLSTAPSHCRPRAHGALLVSPLSECPASGGKEACVGSTSGETEWVRRAVGAVAGSPDNWSHLATQPGLRACTAPSFLPSFLPEKHLEHLHSPLPAPAAPSPSLTLPASRPALTALPKPTAPPSVTEVASPSVCAETARLSPPRGELSAGNRTCRELC